MILQTAGPHESGKKKRPPISIMGSLFLFYSADFVEWKVAKLDFADDGGF